MYSLLRYTGIITFMTTVALAQQPQPGSAAATNATPQQAGDPKGSDIVLSASLFPASPIPTTPHPPHVRDSDSSTVERNIIRETWDKGSFADESSKAITSPWDHGPDFRANQARVGMFIKLLESKQMDQDSPPKTAGMIQRIATDQPDPFSRVALNQPHPQNFTPKEQSFRRITPSSLTPEATESGTSQKPQGESSQSSQSAVFP